MFGPTRSALAHQLERERTRNRERETELVNQILYLSGRMWTPPPVAPEEPQAEQDVYVSALDLLPDER